MANRFEDSDKGFQIQFEMMEDCICAKSKLDILSVHTSKCVMYQKQKAREDEREKCAEEFLQHQDEGITELKARIAELEEEVAQAIYHTGKYRDLLDEHIEYEKENSELKTTLSLLIRWIRHSYACDGCERCDMILGRIDDMDKDLEKQEYEYQMKRTETLKKKEEVED